MYPTRARTDHVLTAGGSNQHPHCLGEPLSGCQGGPFGLPRSIVSHQFRPTTLRAMRGRLSLYLALVGTLGGLGGLAITTGLLVQRCQLRHDFA